MQGFCWGAGAGGVFGWGGFGEYGYGLGVGDGAVAAGVLGFVESFVRGAEERERSGVWDIGGAGGTDAGGDVKAANAGIESAPANEIDDALGVFGDARGIAPRIRRRNGQLHRRRERRRQSAWRIREELHRRRRGRRNR